MMLIAVIGIFVSFTRTPVQPCTARGNNNTAGGNNNTAGVVGVSINEIGPLDIQNDRPFTDTATILNLLNLKSIMGCPGGTRSVFSALFRQKENFTVYFSGKRQSLLHPNAPQRSLFPITIFFLGKLKEKLARKARVYILSEYIGSCSCPPGHPIILLISNKFNMASVSVKKFVTLYS